MNNIAAPLGLLYNIVMNNIEVLAVSVIYFYLL